MKETTKKTTKKVAETKKKTSGKYPFEQVDKETLKKKITTIITSVQITQVTDKRFPANKSKKSYENDQKKLIATIEEILVKAGLADDVTIITNEDGSLAVQVFKTEEGGK